MLQSLNFLQKINKDSAVLLIIILRKVIDTNQVIVPIKIIIVEAELFGRKLH